MKKRSKALIVGLSVLCLAIPLSSCGAKWNEVTEFLNGMYIAENTWEGVSYTYTCKGEYDVIYLDADTKEEFIDKGPYSIKESSIYKIDDNGGVTGKMSFKEDTYVGPLTVGNYGEYFTGREVTSKEYYYNGETDEEYTHTKVVTETDKDFVDEFYQRVTTTESYTITRGGFSGEDTGDAISEIERQVLEATRGTSSNLGVISASIRGKSVSWTMRDDERSQTITIKTDSHYAVNYISVEEKYEEDMWEETTKEVWKKVSGGIVSQPSWVSKNLSRFDDGGENENTKGTVTINIDSSATVVAGETLELPYTVTPKDAEVVATSDHEEYVTADAQDGILYLRGVAEGSAIVTLVGTCKEYAETNVNINVSVVTGDTV